MILGKFLDRRVVLPINFCLMNDTDLIINCVVDTGFNDYLTLPPQLPAAMELPFNSTDLDFVVDFEGVVTFDRYMDLKIDNQSNRRIGN
jgi:predicted aspartyl protease